MCTFDTSRSRCGAVHQPIFPWTQSRPKKVFWQVAITVWNILQGDKYTHTCTCTHTYTHAHAHSHLSPFASMKFLEKTLFLWGPLCQRSDSQTERYRYLFGRSSFLTGQLHSFVFLRHTKLTRLVLNTLCGLSWPWTYDELMMTQWPEQLDDRSTFSTLSFLLRIESPWARK